jgi:hypothetical protein
MRRPVKVPLDRMKFPLTLAGGLRNAFAERRFDAAPATPGGARAPIEDRSRRTLRGGSQPWGERNRLVEPY